MFYNRCSSMAFGHEIPRQLGAAESGPAPGQAVAAGEGARSDGGQEQHGAAARARTDSAMSGEGGVKMWGCLTVKKIG